jgi:integrase
MSPLSAIFKTALNDGLIYLPCKGIKLPTVPEAEKEILTVEEFDQVFHQLTDFVMQMLLEAGIKTRIRVHDLRATHISWLLAGEADLEGEGVAGSGPGSPAM